MCIAARLLLTLGFCGVAYGNVVDPPERVGRVIAVFGEVELASAGRRGDAAVRNMPVTSGDRIVTDGESRAELSLGAGKLRLDGDTDVDVLKLDADIVRLGVRSGTVGLHLGELRGSEAFDFQLPRTMIHLTQEGSYRIAVAIDGTATIAVHAGKAAVRTGVAGFELQAREEAHVAADRTVSVEPGEALTDFDVWSARRQRDFSGKQSAQHVARGVVGYEDLDAYGKWLWVRELGMVWEPTRVARSWVPFRFGEWIWKAPWGWTWVDDAPWGFAPFHYGRWVQLDERWCWVPGPRQIRAVYAPALVGWVSDADERERIGWFALGPQEEYVPPYRASAAHHRTLNVFGRSRSRADSTAESSSPVPTNAQSITWADRSIFVGHSSGEPARARNPSSSDQRSGPAARWP